MRDQQNNPIIIRIKSNKKGIIKGEYSTLNNGTLDLTIKTNPDTNLIKLEWSE